MIENYEKCQKNELNLQNEQLIKENKTLINRITSLDNELLNIYSKFDMFQSEITYLENNKGEIKNNYSNKILILNETIKNLEFKNKSLINELDMLVNKNENLDIN